MRKLSNWVRSSRFGKACVIAGSGLLPLAAKAQMADGTNSVNSLFGIVDYGSNKGSAIVLGFIGFAIAVGLVVWVGRKSGFKAR